VGNGSRRTATRLVGVAGLCLAGLLGGGTPAAAEPNDTPAGASGPIQSGRMYESAIETENDRDWWVFYSGASTQINAALWGRGPDDCFGPVMYLKDASGYTLGDRAGPANTSTSAHILYTVGPGTYYLEVAPYNVAPCIGPDARYAVWINSSLALLTAPPVVPPPPPPPSPSGTIPPPKSVGSGSGPSAFCRHARQRAAALSRALQRARTASDRRRIRGNLQTAQRHVRSFCR
jgi:hypothetical protein